MQIPTTIDLIQECEGALEIPEIRVWCHPHKIKKRGDDYYHKFETFEDAMLFIERNPELAESYPLIAFKGYEINIFAIKLRSKPRMSSHIQTTYEHLNVRNIIYTDRYSKAHLRDCLERSNGIHEHLNV